MTTFVYSRDRTAIPHIYFWNAANHLFEAGQKRAPGFGYLYLAGIVFYAFSLESFLNHIGNHFGETWFDKKDRTPIRKKLEKVQTHLKLTNASPWTVVEELIAFRDLAAHGKDTPLHDQKQIEGSVPYLDPVSEFLRAPWEVRDIDNAIRIKSEIETVLNTLNHKLYGFEFPYGANDFQVISTIAIDGDK
ncbi:MAG: hypothetical protein NW215_08095 [Hyphomicrobiales bacterium]|nr:hypothetical protein [Hyphomicrobiales bacterium]